MNREKEVTRMVEMLSRSTALPQTVAARLPWWSFRV